MTFLRAEGGFCHGTAKGETHDNMENSDDSICIVRMPSISHVRLHYVHMCSVGIFPAAFIKRLHFPSTGCRSGLQQALDLTEVI